MAVLDRIYVDMGDVISEVVIVAYGMFPESSLPNTSFTTDNSAISATFTGSNPT